MNEHFLQKFIQAQKTFPIFLAETVWSIASTLCCAAAVCSLLITDLNANKDLRAAASTTAEKSSHQILAFRF